MITKGKIVKVYQKPFTKEDYEGLAVCRVFVRITPGTNKAEEWWVHFVNENDSSKIRNTSDHDNCYRTVWPEDVIDD